jgi:hypothetical protein
MLLEGVSPLKYHVLVLPLAAEDTAAAAGPFLADKLVAPDVHVLAEALLAHPGERGSRCAVVLVPVSERYANAVSMKLGTASVRHITKRSVYVWSKAKDVVGRVQRVHWRVPAPERAAYRPGAHRVNAPIHHRMRDVVHRMRRLEREYADLPAPAERNEAEAARACQIESSIQDNRHTIARLRHVERQERRVARRGYAKAAV